MSKARKQETGSRAELNPPATSSQVEVIVEPSTLGYRAIAEKYRSEILTGSLLPGSRLPSIREVARLNKVAPTTASRAFAELTKMGLVEGRSGGGTSVAKDFRGSGAVDVVTDLPRAGHMPGFERLGESIGLRSLVTGVPDFDLFPADEFIAAFEELRRGSPWAWYYSPVAGMADLRHQIHGILRKRNIRATDEDVLVTNGSVHAIATILEVLLTPGKGLILEQPSFLGANEMCEALRLIPTGVRLTGEGIDLDDFKKVAKKLQGGVAVLFPTFHPASGECQSRPQELLELAAKYDITLVEVDRYRDLAFSRPPPPLASFSDQVLYVDSFSYNLTGGLRIGYVRAPREMLKKFILRLSATSFGPSAIMQTALTTFLARGGLNAHLKRVVPEYKRRRDAILHSLQLHFPKGSHWSTPLGGYALWAKLPAGNWDGLYEKAVSKGVAFTPSELLLIKGDPSQMRLTFGKNEPEATGAAIEALGRLIKQRMKGG